MNILLEIIAAGLLSLACGLSSAGEVLDGKVLENGGSGPYKAVVVSDSAFEGYAVYRPENLKAAVRKEGRLPLIVFGNGGCRNSSVEFQKFLNEIASHGYVVVAIGPLSFKTVEETNSAIAGMTDASQLNKAIDIMSARVTDKDSDYYGKVDMDRVCAMGQSCGGLQALTASVDPRVTTSVILNSGIFKEGGSSMGGTMGKDGLAKLHAPVVYLIGGKSDIAYENALDDFEKIGNVPVVLANLPVGHLGTYQDAYGGEFAQVALKWLDWQLKGGKKGRAFFLGGAEDRTGFENWTVEYKNFKVK